jgi:predicted DNA binding protein
MTTEHAQVKRLRLKTTPRRERFHPIERPFAVAEDVRREAVLDIRLVDSRTAIVLYLCSGDPAAVRRAYGSEAVEEWAHSYQLFGHGDDVLGYIQFELNDVIRGWLELQREHRILYRHPTAYTRDGGASLTLIGETEGLQNAVESLGDWVDVTVVQVGEYWAGEERLFHLLTERQRETLRAAIEAGYYESPRQATHDDVAAALDRTTATVAEHLQKVESTVLHEILPG